VRRVDGPTRFEQDVAAVLRSLEPGDLLTYGEVAAEAGHPGAARAVGSLLRRSGPEEFPWWRVVTSTGRLVPGDTGLHARLLRAEGWRIEGHSVTGPAEPGC
jgi:methylated-DNA-protein-cysteine methyltransferase-like protein